MWNTNKPNRWVTILGWALATTPFVGIAIFAYLVITRWL